MLPCRLSFFNNFILNRLDLHQMADLIVAHKFKTKEAASNAFGIRFTNENLKRIEEQEKAIKDRVKAEFLHK